MQGGTLSQGSTLEEALYKLSVELQPQLPQLGPGKKRKVLCIGGPTSVGKSELALILADKMGGEIVSCDSMQVYRGMNIGTAKPTLEQQLQIPHHLVDIRDLHEKFDVVQFYKEVLFACQRIHERENIPIVVGGSGFYMHTLLYGPPSGPPPNPLLRAKIEKEMEENGIEKLFEELQGFDPTYAQTITSHDKHKIARALEVIRSTGKRISDRPWREKVRSNRYDFKCWFFSRPRESLYQRISQRCEQMCTQGLIQETEQLLKQQLKDNSTASTSIGYKQAIAFLESKQTEEDYQIFLEEFKKATRHLAKRQLTWFRREKDFKWIDLDLHDSETVIDILLNDFLRWEWEK